MIYLLLRELHVTCVVLSGLGFLLRGILRLLGSSLWQRRWLRIAPHAVDTVLLASAVSLAVYSGQLPLQQPWLTAKVIGLLVYIGLGMAAFRFSRSKVALAVNFGLALAVYTYIVSVAVTRNPAGLFG